MTHRYHYAWQSPDGSQETVLDFSRLPEDGSKTPDEIARSMGWPGHFGRPADYRRERVRRALARIRAIFR